MKNHRPDGWYKIRGGVTGCADPDCRCNECVSYEAGADAYKEALKKESNHKTSEAYITYFEPMNVEGLDKPVTKIMYPDGWLVFIPEEAKE